MSGRAPRRAPPGPRGHWLWGSRPEQKRDPLGLMMRNLREHGDVVGFRLGPLRALQLNHPDHVKHVLVDNAQGYVKWRAIQRIRPFLGEGLLLSEGDVWKRQRRLMQPAFHRDHLAALAHEMTGAIAGLLARLEPLPEGALLDVSGEMMRLVLSIAGRVLFSIEVGDQAQELGRAFNIALEGASERLLSFNPLWDLLPTRSNRRFRRAMRLLNAVVFELIRKRREGTGAHRDLLTLLLEMRDPETGEAMSDRQLRDEVMTLFSAGRGPSGYALTWVWYLLARHPEVERKLRAELADTLEGRPPGAGDLPRLRYTTMVLEETLRLYPPVWNIPRQARAPDEIGGYDVRPGTIVFLSPYVIHRHPGFWEEPERFDPERFAPERARQRHRAAYFPFGLGQRQCIGAGFAMMEAQLAVATIAQRFRLSLPAGQAVEEEALITLRPRGGLRMHLHRAGAPSRSRPLEHEPDVGVAAGPQGLVER